jgi:hypothetical protein
MVQELRRGDGVAIRTVRSPIRIDGHRSCSALAAPSIGENTAALCSEFGL